MNNIPSLKHDEKDDFLEPAQKIPRRTINTWNVHAYLEEE